MNTTVLTSTFILTLLLSHWVYFSFIRASTKDRESSRWFWRLMTRKLPYCRDWKRTLQSAPTKLRRSIARLILLPLKGLVRPSVFLAALLTGLAAIGSMCLALVLSDGYCRISVIYFWLLILVAPLAGWFYWAGSIADRTSSPAK